jgi:2-iminobutanoate/2-iminopropanoate deaminase
VIKVYPQLPSMQKLMEAFQIKNASAIEVDGLIYVSGSSAVDLATGEMIKGEDIREHAELTLKNFDRMLGEIGLSLDNVIKVNCYLQEPVRDFPAWNEVYKATFREPYPCRTTVGAPLVIGLIELDLVVSRHKRQEGLQ